MSLIPDAVFYHEYRMGTTPVIAIVVPCYNEEQALPLSVPKMLDVIDRMVADGIASAESYVLLCNDGSKDRTWDVSKAYPWHITEAINMCFWRG